MRAIKTTTISILAIGLLAGSAVGVAAQSAAVTGSISTGDDCSMTPQLMSCTGGRFEFDDPRLTGDYETTITTASGFETGVDGEVITEEFRVTNDEGAWSGQSIYGVLFLEDGEDGEGGESDTVDPGILAGAAVGPSDVVAGGTNMLLIGEDAYEGLTAWVYTPFNGMSAQGIIVEAESME